jgi:WD40 repeat protein
MLYACASAPVKPARPKNCLHVPPFHVPIVNIWLVYPRFAAFSAGIDASSVVHASGTMRHVKYSAILCLAAVIFASSCTLDTASVRKEPRGSRRDRASAKGVEDRITLAEERFTARIPGPDYTAMESLHDPKFVFQRSHEKGIIDIAISPDSKIIVSASRDRTVKIWSADGVLLTTIPFPDADFLCLAISPDGMEIAVGARMGIYLLTIDGRLVKTLDGEHDRLGSHYDARIAYAPDGSIFTTSGNRNVVIRNADWSIRTVVQAHDGQVKHLALSPRGGFFVTCGNLTRSKDGWNASSRKWDMQGNLLLDLETDKPDKQGGKRRSRPGGDASLIAISPDGSIIALMQKTIRLLTVNGDLTAEFPVEHSLLHGFFFTPDAKGFIINGYDNFYRYGIDGSYQGRMKTWISGDKAGGGALCMALSSDGRFLAAGFQGDALFDGRLRIWDRRGSLVKDLRPMALETQRLVFSPDGTRIFLELEWGRKTIAWNVPGPYLVEIPESIGFTAKGEEFRFYVDKRLHFHYKSVGIDTKFDGRWLLPLPDGTVLTQGGVIYDREGVPLRRIYFKEESGGMAHFSEAAVEKDMNYIVRETSIHNGGVHELTLFDMNAAEIGQFQMDEPLADGAIAAHGDTIATGHESGTVCLWNTKGMKLRTFAGHILPVKALAFSADGRYLASSSADRTVRLRKLDDGSSVTMIALMNGEWYAFDDAGRFECSSGARDQVRFVRGLTAYNAAQFWDVLYTPGLTGGLLKGMLPGPVDMSVAVRSTPEVTVTIQERGTGEGTASVAVCARPREAGLGKVFIIHNGRVLDESSRGLTVQAREGCRVFTLALEPGVNSIAGGAYEATGRVFGSSMPLRLDYVPADVEKPDLYILAAGVSEYRDANLKLGFPADDAKAVSAAFSDTGAPIYGKVIARVLTDRDATRKSIMDAMRDIASTAGKTDTVMIFIAGHGDTEGGAYYFLPHDADLARLKESALSVEDLGAFIRSLAANKVVLLLDTCKSGAATDAIHRLAASRGLEETKIIARIAKEHGIAVFSAASVSQDAFEIKALRHGIFTYCLLEALGGKSGEIEEDGVITIARLLARVNRMTRETAQKHLGTEQSPVLYIFGEDFAIGGTR